jgi:hypothetical protein
LAVAVVVAVVAEAVAALPSPLEWVFLLWEPVRLRTLTSRKRTIGPTTKECISISSFLPPLFYELVEIIKLKGYLSRDIFEQKKNPPISRRVLF